MVSPLKNNLNYGPIIGGQVTASKRNGKNRSVIIFIRGFGN
jgi:hypothetical protein